MTRVDDVLAEYDEESEIENLATLSKTHAPESRAADIIAARRLLGNFRYAPGLGWLEWNGMRWDDDPVIEDRVNEVVRRYIDHTEHEMGDRVAQISEELKADHARVMRRVPDSARKDDKGEPVSEAALFDQHATEDEKEFAQKRMAEQARVSHQREMWLNMLSGSKIRALTWLCRGQDGILTRSADFDARPDLLNCTNGVVDLRTGELLKHDPDLLMTKIAGGAYVPGTTHPRWTQALEAVPNDVKAWFQVRIGQSFTGHTPEDDSLVVARGGGENGKTAIMMAVMRAAGSYGRPISHRVLMPQQPGQHTTDLMDLRGLRFALLEETPEEGHLDTHQLKVTIGTPTITARLMRRNNVTFDTSHTLWINTNHLPQVDTTDHGTWRRLKVCPFPTKFLKPGQEPTENHEKVGDIGLKPALKQDEGVVEAVLAWAVAGAVSWYQNGRQSLLDPQRVEQAIQEWRSCSDVAYLFATEYLVREKGWYITGEQMRAQFGEFLEAEGKRPWSAKTLNTRLPDAMTAAGCQADTGPDKSVRVQEGEHESKPEGAFPPDGWRTASGTPSLRPGQKARIWRGVRFTTVAERRGAATLQVV